MSRIPYAGAVGSLLCAMVCTRLDIAHAVGVLRRYISKLGKEYWTFVKSFFKYLHGTTNHAIYYQGRARLDIILDVHVFVDAD